MSFLEIGQYCKVLTTFRYLVGLSSKISLSDDSSVHDIVGEESGLAPVILVRSRRSLMYLA